MQPELACLMDSLAVMVWTAPLDGNADVINRKRLRQIDSRTGFLHAGYRARRSLAVVCNDRI